MNIQIQRQVLSLSRRALERMCLSYLRMLARSQHVEKAVVAPREGPRNWIVAEIAPPLPITADNEARNAIAELQTQFLLGE